MGDDILRRLDRIESKLETVRKMLRRCMLSEKTPPRVPPQGLTKHHEAQSMLITGSNETMVYIYTLKLTDSLRRTMLVMDKLQEATASDVASRTGRTRSTESGYLNQLERMGYLEKFRKGRKTYFRIPSIILSEFKKKFGDGRR